MLNTSATDPDSEQTANGALRTAITRAPIYITRNPILARQSSP